MRLCRSFLVVAGLLPAALRGQQQQVPPIRPIGPIERVSHDTLKSASQGVVTLAGRLFVNDIVARRVVLFDSTLGPPMVVADSTGATANAYGTLAGGLIRFRGDSALLVTPTSISMLVLSPSGTIVRTMAMPPSPTRSQFGPINQLQSGMSFDGQGRLLSYQQVRPEFGRPPPGTTGTTVTKGPDSAFVIRFDLQTRKYDTVTVLRSMPFKTVMRVDANSSSSSSSALFLGMVDDWTMAGDGTVAVVRGRDYHVDWLSPDGVWTSTPRMAFSWVHLSDERKRQIIDSATAQRQAQMDSSRAQMLKRFAEQNPGRGAQVPPAPIYAPVEPDDLPDYWPPMRQSSTRADADGNLWVQTSTIVDGRPVYDVISRQGVVIDRVQLPNFRRIIAFSPGKVYLAVVDSVNVVHVERARIK